MKTGLVRLKKVFLAFVVLCLASLACLTPSLLTPGDYVEKFGGDIAVYTRILELTDCTELEREFERADENARLLESGTQEHQASIGYRTAAENRIKEVECREGL
jgi:hypothetical protein